MNRIRTLSLGPAARLARICPTRLLDVIGSGALLIVTLPLLAVCCLSLSAAHGRPILARHERTLSNGQHIYTSSFRTAGNRDSEGVLDRFLSATRIEDLPRVLDVLRGDLSLVGPDDRKAFHD